MRVRLVDVVMHLKRHWERHCFQSRVKWRLWDCDGRRERDGTEEGCAGGEGSVMIQRLRGAVMRRAVGEDLEH